MNFPFFKKRVNDEEIREKLALLLCKGVLTSEEDLSTYQKIFTDVNDDKIIRKELAGFDAYVTLVAISSFYKDKKEGLGLFDNFINVFEDAIVKKGVFKSRSECHILIERRAREYSEIMQNKKDENYLIPLSLAISKNFGSGSLSSSIAMASVFVNMTKANMKFLSDVNKTI